MKKKTVILIGNGALASRCAKLIFDYSDLELSYVIVDGGPKKYGTGLELMTKKLGVPFSIEVQVSLSEFVKIAKGIKPDYLLSICNSQILSAEILTNVGLAINFHNSPLPKYAGSNACSWALVNADTEYGITFHKIEPKVDAGDIIFQKKFAISPATTALELTNRCAQEGYALFAENIATLANSTLSFQPQDLQKREFHLSTEVPHQGWLDPAWPVQTTLAFLRGFDYLPLTSPIGSPKMKLKKGWFHIHRGQEALGVAAKEPGHLEADSERIYLHLADGVIELTQISHPECEWFGYKELMPLLG